MADPIRFYKGEETGIIREEYSNRKMSIFAEQYTMALEAIKSYLTVSKSSDKSDVYDRSNIFAFIGDRGTGKTSCMQSVADMLEPYYKDDSKEDLKSLILPIIDPTIFDEKSNILNVVIGTLFQKFREDVSRDRRYDDSERRQKEFDDRKQSLLEAFQKVRDCLRIINDPNSFGCNDDDISQLADMASVSVLHKRMENLVEEYLRFFDRNVLVLQIDDIDLQTKYAYTMIEEIRKYFVLPKVVILMSFKLEQLTKVIELENANNFKELKNYGLIGSANLEEIAARYLLKLIPVNHRIYMPTFEVYADSLIEYFPNHEPNQKSLIGDGSPISVKYAVTALIYEKCRFLFYHSKGVVSPIVPRNLRELRFLLAMLANMKDYYYAGKDSDIAVQKSNKEQFLNYFNNTWVNNNISAENLSIINAIRGTKDASSINKVVLRELKVKYSDILTDEYNEILNEKNSSFNISVADVYTILDFIKYRKNSSDDKLLIFFVQTFYSMKLYEYYDELTYNADNELPPFDKPFDKNEDEDNGDDKFDKYDYTDESIRKMEVVDGISRYEQLVGGLFVNTDIYHFMPKGSDKKTTQDKLLVNLKTLKEEAEKLVNEKDKTKIDSIKLQLIEIVSLCVYRLVEGTQGSRGNIDYRMSSGIVYGFNSRREYYSGEFNIGSFFFNIVNIKGAYDRINPKLFGLAYKHQDKSLYGKLLADSKKDRGDWCNTPTHALLSRAAIRNFEILDDLIVKVQYNWGMRSRGSLSANLKALFNRIGKYKIKTYDRRQNKNNETGKENIKGNEKGMPLVISFDYADIIADVFGGCIIEGKTGKDKEMAQKRNDFLNSFLSALVVELEGFDVEQIMKEKFTGQESYAEGTIGKRYREIVVGNEKYANTKSRFYKLMREKMNEQKRVSVDDIKKILQQIKEEYNLE